MQPSILIVEDDVFIRAMIGEFLRDAGLDVVEADNADAALKVLESGAPIDVVFSDIRMPGSMDGCDLAERIRAAWPETPVLLASGYSTAPANTGDNGDRFLAKPYRPLTVLATILSMIERPAAHAS